MRVTGPSRRALIGAALGFAGSAATPRASTSGTTVRIGDPQPGGPISPFVYGANEIGTMDGGAPSAQFDCQAGVTARRLGGNLMTTYNWVSGFSNAGKDDDNKNGDYLADALGIPQAQRRLPGAVIESMHRTSLSMGAISLVTLPLAGYVAADGTGPVETAEAAPSRRFLPVRWWSNVSATQAIDPTIADIPQLLRRLQHSFGSAADATGIRAYALDNEPGLWPETHPRVVPHPMRIGELLKRSIAAATVIKSIDPAAWIIGPASWGATEMATFQNAADWNDYQHYGSFLAAYLDAFRQASERVGHRLLDALDVHWYPFSSHGDLFRTEDPTLAPFLLDAPRSLTEPGFREESWVSQALPVSLEGGLKLPLLPSLGRLCAAWFPGTQVAVTEFNYGGAGQLASGLALADVLGRLGTSGTLLATHWGSLAGWLGQAYRLYRNYDGAGSGFGSLGLRTDVSGPASVSAFAAHQANDPRRLHVIVLNKSSRPEAVDLVLDPSMQPAGLAEYGFDGEHPTTGLIAPRRPAHGVPQVLILPARSARHYVIDS